VIGYRVASTVARHLFVGSPFKAGTWPEDRAFKKVKARLDDRPGRSFPETNKGARRRLCVLLCGLIRQTSRRTSG
jgi:hypothetical protein